MLRSSLRRSMIAMKEGMGEAVSLLAEVVLGKPSKVLADCMDQVASTCGACGADKRRYKHYCHCPGGGWCYQYTFCDYC